MPGLPVFLKLYSAALWNVCRCWVLCVELLNATKISFFTSRQFMLEPLLFGFYKWQKSNLRCTETDPVGKGDSLDLPSLWANFLLEYLGLAMVSSQLKCLPHNPEPPTQTHTRAHGLNHLCTLLRHTHTLAHGLSHLCTLWCSNGSLTECGQEVRVLFSDD